MILIGDAYEQLATLPSKSVQCCVTSPPYWALRDYGVDGQIGLESSPQAYIGALLMIFEQVHRVLKDDGTLWLNLGDSYATGAGKADKAGGRAGINSRQIHAKAVPDCGPNRLPIPGLKAKDLIGIPWRLALSLQSVGWYLRQDIIWSKPNPMPESVRDRCTKSHEYLFLLAKSERYFFDSQAIREPTSHGREAKWDNGLDGHGGGESHAGQGSSTRKFSRDPGRRNRRTVWTVAPKPVKGATHFATFPPALIEPCILAGSRPDDTVLDPFFGTGTTGLVAKAHGRRYIGIELNPTYAELARGRIG